jgi:hypothetical protein
MLEGKKSVSSWKEKNVTLKEKHLHAKKTRFISAMFYKIFTTKYTYQMFLLRNRIFYLKSSLLSSFSSTENGHFCYLDLARKLCGKNIVCATYNLAMFFKVFY